MRGNATVLILRPSAVGADVDGNPVTATTTSIAVRGAIFRPDPQEELHDVGRNGVVDRGQVFIPPAYEIRRTDRVSVDGIIFEVDADAARWVSPFTQRNWGAAVAVRRAEG